MNFDYNLEIYINCFFSLYILSSAQLFSREPTATTKTLHQSWKKNELHYWKTGLTCRPTLVISRMWVWYNLISRRIPRRKKTTTREDGSTEYILQFIYHFSSLISFDFDDRRLNVNILLESLAGMKNTLITYIQKNRRQQISRFLKLLTSGRSRNLQLLRRITIITKFLLSYIKTVSWYFLDCVKTHCYCCLFILALDL